jgi:hypothetical protein
MKNVISAGFCRALLAPAALLVLAACDDPSAPTAAGPLPDGGLEALRCMVRLPAGELACVAVPGGDISASRSEAGGPSREQRTIGGQGTYVRLAGSGITSVDGVFSIDVTVQNLSNQPLGTADGTTPHASGVRVFFADGPNVTSGSGEVAVQNPTGTAMFSAPDQPYFQYGGVLDGADQKELGDDGRLWSTEVSGAKTWRFQVDEGVGSFGFTVYVSAETPAGTLASVAPRITSIQADTLRFGRELFIWGENFANYGPWNTVRIGGVPAYVVSGGVGGVTVIVPCVPSGPVTVTVEHSGMVSLPVQHVMRAPRLTLQAGESALADFNGCTELMPTGTDSRYLLGVFGYTETRDLFTVQLTGDPGALPTAGPYPSLSPSPSPARAAGQDGEDARHLAVLEANRAAFERLRGRSGGSARPRPGVRAAVALAAPPATRTFKVVDVTAGCGIYHVVAATRVFYDGKIAIYEDDATPAALRAGANPAMQAYYDRLGAEYNADMEPILRTNFGDPLRRDAETDANGVVVALFTPRVNAINATGFVSGCDLYADDDPAEPGVGGPYTGSAGTSNAASNHGEVYYGRVPTATGSGYAADTPDEWFRLIRTSLIHEVKHVVSLAARVANGAFEWERVALEEGTARVAQELWARRVDGFAWKSDAGYGSDAEPMGVYCDLRPTWAPCASPLRPASTVERHFTRLYTALDGDNALKYSGLIRTPADNGSYYFALGWSQVRFVADRYPGPEAEFLTRLTQSTAYGWPNLAELAGLAPMQMLADWQLSLATDGVVGRGPDANPFPSWNLADVFAGLHADQPGTYTRAHPIQPILVAFGRFAPHPMPMYGGGVRWFELSGTHDKPQMLRLLKEQVGNAWEVRMTIVRVQ